MKMFYTFPIINTLDDVLPAIVNHEEINAKDKGGYTVVDYMINTFGTFEDPNEAGISEQESLYRKIRRECRGLVFDAEGKLISRPYHKFHNLGERPEYAMNTIDMNFPHSIYEKLDGSMIHAYILDGKVRWATRAGHETDVAKMAAAFVEKYPRYEEFARSICENGSTPIFEFCSRKNRVVIDYPEDMLILTGVRIRDNGLYPFLDVMANQVWQLYGIPTVPSINMMNLPIQKIAEIIRDIDNQEGIVIRFGNGHMIKIKGDQYCQLHKTKELIVFEKDVIRLVLENKMDDVLPKLDDYIRVAVEGFTKTMMDNLYLRGASYNGIVDSFAHMSQKEFAETVFKEYPENAHHLLKIRKLDGTLKETVDYLLAYVLKHSHSATQVESIRSLIGCNWNDYFNNTQK